VGGAYENRAFRFRESCDLVLLTGRKANSLKELVNGLKTLPDSVVYYHTHHFVTQISQLATELPNDFANWIRDVLLEKVIAERVAALDIMTTQLFQTLRMRLLGPLKTTWMWKAEEKHLKEWSFTSWVSKLLSLILASKQGICRSFMKALKSAESFSVFSHGTIKASFRKPYQ